VKETLAPGAVVSVVARRHGLTPQQLFTWRRRTRQRADAETLAFVPAVIAPEPTAATTPAQPPRQRAARAMSRRRVAVIAIDVAGVKVTIENGASPATIATVIGALKSGA